MAEYNPSKIIKDGNTYNFRDDTKIPLAGSNAISGSLIPATDNAYNFGDSSHNFKIVYAYAVHNGVNNKSLALSGGNNTTNGANLVLYGANRTDGFQGNFILMANDGTSSYVLKGHQSGMLSWSGNVIRPTTDNACDLGNSTYNFKNVYAYKLILKNADIVRAVNTDRLSLCGGTSDSDGAYITIFGVNSTVNAGGFRLRANNGTNSKDLIGKLDGTLTWNGQSIQTTSDQRYKQQIAEIDDKLLDAWEDVDLVQFKYNDAVDQKGKDKARLHTGFVVQQIYNACKSHNVDISAYGLYCHEEYPQETEEVEVEQADGTKTKETKVIREASEHYSLRYTEALIVECAYLRKKLKELTARIEQLEKGNNVK